MYDYREAVKNDVREAIEENVSFSDFSSREELEENLNERMFCADSITGNGSGSYTFNTWQAEEYLSHNWDLLAEALESFGCGLEYLEQGAEACDVAIRCYLLGESIAEVLDEYDI